MEMDDHSGVREKGFARLGVLPSAADNVRSPSVAEENAHGVELPSASASMHAGANVEHREKG
jgi:hypothetical protein